MTTFALVSSFLGGEHADASDDPCIYFAGVPDDVSASVHGYPRGEVNAKSVVGAMLHLAPAECEYFWTLVLTSDAHEQLFEVRTSGEQDHFWVDAKLDPGSAYEATLAHQYSEEPFRWSFLTRADPSPILPVDLSDQVLRASLTRRGGEFYASWGMSSPSQSSSDRLQFLAATGGDVVSENPLGPGLPIYAERRFDDAPELEDIECIPYRQVTPDGIVVQEGESCDPHARYDVRRCSCDAGSKRAQFIAAPIAMLLLLRRRRLNTHPGDPP